MTWSEKDVGETVELLHSYWGFDDNAGVAIVAELARRHTAYVVRAAVQRLFVSQEIVRRPGPQVISAACAREAANVHETAASAVGRSGETKVTWAEYVAMVERGEVRDSQGRAMTTERLAAAVGFRGFEFPEPGSDLEEPAAF